MRGNGNGTTLSWLQFLIGSLALVGTVLWSWHSITTTLEIGNAVQSEQLDGLRSAVSEQGRRLDDVRERVVRLEERWTK